ncbi:MULTISPECIES: hypothetical protein [Weeksellaceae]|uniref:Uncharacterized protein n=1 Tax=Riemerella anatipestifer TaxID=34085 RepID=A0AAP3EZI8_RIEAN|nr:MULTISPECIES: hypothetical protein [Weeksellaceae]AZZ57573.1 hypothetical protein AWB57_00120 [Riemerella anatipestifer]AZZ57749.1 hypothetical protein AWB57_01080 [Riemerella anatipestifer]MBT0552621.1 hypothetical protein [Riemerella anatipestifer]MBT0552857.1 hypothetical protein [Riemerella anatipestifer]MBT0573836.1 hypothetical protein [Riemerella anatipestifer]
MLNILLGIISTVFIFRAMANREKLDRCYRMDINIEQEEFLEILNTIVAIIFGLAAFIDWNYYLNQ